MTLKYPIEIANGKVVIADFERGIAQSIVGLLSNSSGSTFFDRGTGSLLRQCMYEPIIDVRLAKLEYYIKQVLKKEPRINVQRIDLDNTQIKDGVVIARIFYNITSTNENRNVSLNLSI
jgi:phage baseplate assembly protein W